MRNLISISVRPSSTKPRTSFLQDRGAAKLVLNAATGTKETVTNLVTGSLQLASNFNESGFQSEDLSILRRFGRHFVSGEGIVNDVLVGTGELLKKSVAGLSEYIKPLKSFALKSGLALLGPIGLGAAACLLAADGPREAIEGFQERDFVKGLEGTRSTLLAAEALSMASQMAFSISPGMVTQVAGVVGKALAPPLMVAQICVDAGQGIAKLARSHKTKNKHLMVDGLTDLGMATALTLGVALGPAVSVPLAGAVLVGKFLNNRLEKKDPGYVKTKLKSVVNRKQISFGIGPSSAALLA